MRPIVLLFAMAALAIAQRFDIASIKADDSNERRNVKWDPDTLTIVNLPLANIMFQAYELAPWQYDFNKFLPLFTQRYDIVAKASGRASRHELQLMLQNLLAERFHMVVHHEERIESVFALVVEKGGHKLQPPAAPDRDGDFDKRLGPNETVQSIVFRNTSMKLLAIILMEAADTSKFRPEEPAQIVDKTELQGGFDFKLEWTLEEPQAGDTAPPDRLPALNAALHRVGLTLKTDKAPIDHLVVDKIDKSPTEN